MIYSCFIRIYGYRQSNTKSIQHILVHNTASIIAYLQSTGSKKNCYWTKQASGHYSKGNHKQNRTFLLVVLCNPKKPNWFLEMEHLSEAPKRSANNIHLTFSHWDSQQLCIGQGVQVVLFLFMYLYIYKVITGSTGFISVVTLCCTTEVTEESRLFDHAKAH